MVPALLTAANLAQGAESPGGVHAAPRAPTASKKASLVQAQEAERMHQSGSIFLDVRTPHEFVTRGHVADAVNVPWLLIGSDGAMQRNELFLETVEKLAPDRGGSMIVGCQTGLRAPPATLELMNAGYTKVVSLQGGLDAWVAASLPCVH